ncbi:MAG TPA: efflux RND transporter periplasmic adaptor subunit [Thermoanaerobaculia bacterium]|nr:efflux RND transporter periplasmic adaptor subunit [Thermoanaerobaculia bacterium]
MRLLSSLLVAILACAAAACGSRLASSSSSSPSPSSPPAGEARLAPAKLRTAGISVVPVAYQDLDRVLAATGRVTFDDQRVTHVFSPVNGRVTRLVAQPGQRVAPGDPLAIIQSPDVGSAVSDYAKAQAALAAAERDYQRQKDLFAAHAAAERDLEGAEANVRQARAERDRAEEKARLLGGGKLSKVTQEFVLRSPIAGEVIARAANPGVEVQGQYSGGTAVELYTVGELGRVWVLADVFEADLARIRVGSPVAVEVISAPGRRFEGRLDWISGAIDPATRTAKVRCTIDNGSRLLKPEMYATVSIAVPGRRALAIPRGAVLRQGEQTVVFREVGTTADGLVRFERWPVKVDDEGGDSLVAVLAGLHPGDRVVSAGGILLLGMVS